MESALENVIKGLWDVFIAISLQVLEDEPEVGDVNVTIFDSEIIRLDVSVHEAQFVNLFNTFDHLKE